MKKNKVVVMLPLIAVLLCGCGQTPETVIESQPETVPTEVYVLSEEGTDDVIAYVDVAERFEEFDSYEEFLTFYRAEHPGCYEYTVPDGWTVDSVASWTETNYILNLSREDGTKVGLEIDFTSSFGSIQEFFDTFNTPDLPEGNHFELAGERYMFEYFGDGALMLFGLTGEDNICFSLGSSTLDAENREEQLVSLYQALAL